LRVVAPALKDYEIQDVFSHFDENNDKHIDFDEFKKKLAYAIKGVD
jgi:Ca2+-binding EF-hand superfamily protein